MKKNITLCILSLLSILLLAGCAEKNSDTNLPDPNYENTVTSKPSNEPTKPAATPSGNEFSQPEDDDFQVSGVPEAPSSLTINMELIGSAEVQELTATWTITKGAEVYLLYSSADLNTISIYEVDPINNMAYDKTNPLASYSGLKAGEFITVELFVPEGIPSTLLSVEELSGTVTTYLISYDGKDGGVYLAPLD